jgi:flagellar basal-body rod protein FlgF
MNGLYIAASGAASQLEGLEITANNLANASTPGYRRFIEVMQSVSGNGSPYQFAASGDSPPIDMSQGPIHSTGNPLDIAMTGPGYIAVQTPDGIAYTRNGQLQKTPDGNLLAAGNPVMSATGGTITLAAGPVTIGGDGSISVNGLPAGKIQLGDASGVTMVPAGDSLYKTESGDPLPPLAAGSETVRQGFLESSTGSDIAEMVAMTGVMRNYESAMHAVQAIDENQDRAIQAFTLSA